MTLNKRLYVRRVFRRIAPAVSSRIPPSSVTLAGSGSVAVNILLELKFKSEVPLSENTSICWRAYVPASEVMVFVLVLLEELAPL